MGHHSAAPVVRFVAALDNGSRRMNVWLAREGRWVSRKRVQRAIYRSPHTSRPAPEHRVYSKRRYPPTTLWVGSVAGNRPALYEVNLPWPFCMSYSGYGHAPGAPSTGRCLDLAARGIPPNRDRTFLPQNGRSMPKKNWRRNWWGRGSRPRTQGEDTPLGYPLRQALTCGSSAVPCRPRFQLHRVFSLPRKRGRSLESLITLLGRLR